MYYNSDCITTNHIRRTRIDVRKTLDSYIVNLVNPEVRLSVIGEHME